jgi:protein AFG1
MSAGALSRALPRRDLHAALRALAPRRAQHEAASATELEGAAAAAAAPPPPRPADAADAEFLRLARAARAGPLRAYRRERETGLLRHDPRQEATVLALQRVFEDLVAATPGGGGAAPRSGLTIVDAAEPAAARPWWAGLLPSSGADAPPATPVRGLYMYGGVGTGKTMLMDLFLASCPPGLRARRAHFHDFMLRVHGDLRAARGAPDPLTRVADGLADSTAALCLDELIVADVADAAILRRLFDRLWDRGLVLVATSNRPPGDLYKGGLGRELFLPFIARLQRACVAHDMESPVDYRRLATHADGLYFVGPGAGARLEARFAELANGAPPAPLAAPVAMGRTLALRRVAGCVAYATFDELCRAPLGAADFLALAAARQTVALAGVPSFSAADAPAAHRFVTLVDVLYEARVRLLVAAEAEPDALFARVRTQAQAAAAAAAGGGDDPGAFVDDALGFQKDRTVSRLTEMQSGEYLQAHAAAHAPSLLKALAERDAGARGGGGGAVAAAHTA